MAIAGTDRLETQRACVALGVATMLALVAAPAAAQGTTTGPQLPPRPTAAGAGPTASAEYAEALGRGMNATRAGDRSEAIAAFREAVQVHPSHPDAVCHLAAAQRLAGDMNAALDGFQACLRVARGANHPRWTARALHGIASTLERMPERMAEARTAWQEYVRFADGNAAVTSASAGRARITAIDQVTEQERVMVEVRQRIAAREAVRAQAASGHH